MTSTDATDLDAFADPGAAGELRRRFAVDGAELAWERWGPDDGVPLVLGHGFSGSAHDFALQFLVLSADRPVVAYERRGHGRSDNTGDAASYTIDQLVADEIAFLEAHGGGPVDLLGHSMGGRVAMQVAVERPDLLRSLVLMDTSGWSFRPVDAEKVDLIAAFLAVFDPADGLPDMSVMRGPEDDLLDERVPPGVLERRLELSAAFDPVALRELGLVLFGGTAPSMRPSLPAITCPVTVIVGEHDHPFVDQAADLAGEVADGELVVIDGAYHSPQLSHPAEWTAAVRGHLARAGA